MRPEGSHLVHADHLGGSHACLAEGNVLSMGVHLRQESCMTQPFAFLGPVEAMAPPPPLSLRTESAMCLLASNTRTPVLP